MYNGICIIFYVKLEGNSRRIIIILFLIDRPGDVNNQENDDDEKTGLKYKKMKFNNLF